MTSEICRRRPKPSSWTTSLAACVLFGFCTDGVYRVAYQALAASIKASIGKMAKVPPPASDRVVRMPSDNSKMQGNYQVIFVGHGDHNGNLGTPAPGLQRVRPLEAALARFSCP